MQTTRVAQDTSRSSRVHTYVATSKIPTKVCASHHYIPIFTTLIPVKLVYAVIIWCRLVIRVLLSSAGASLLKDTPLVQCGCRESEKVTSLFTTKKAARYQKTLGKKERKQITDYNTFTILYRTYSTILERQQLNCS